MPQKSKGGRTTLSKTLGHKRGRKGRRIRYQRRFDAFILPGEDESTSELDGLDGTQGRVGWVGEAPGGDCGGDGCGDDDRQQEQVLDGFGRGWGGFRWGESWIGRPVHNRGAGSGDPRTTVLDGFCRGWGRFRRVVVGGGRIASARGHAAPPRVVWQRGGAGTRRGGGGG